MSVLNSGNSLRKVEFGHRVNRTAGTLPQTATGAIFNVTGGRVVVTSIVGQVTTAIQAQATNTKLVATPSGSGAVNDLSAAVDLTGAAVGSLISITGLATDATVKTTGGAVATLRNPIIVAAGAIGVNTAASSTGAIKWTVTYVPLDDGAAVTAA